MITESLLLIIAKPLIIIIFEMILGMLLIGS